jgi:hypothetical protein
MRSRSKAAVAAIPEEQPAPLVSEVIAQESREPQIGEKYDRILTSIFTLDERKVFDTLTEELSFGEAAHRREYAEIFDALDMATRRTDEASRLYASAKVTLAQYLAGVAEYQGDMREQARGALEAAKEGKGGKGKGKAITEADVVAKMAKTFGDEYRRVEVTRARAEEAVAHMKRLLERWEDRGRFLDAMLRSTRKM